jgi:hypothetical protein
MPIDMMKTSFVDDISMIDSIVINEKINSFFTDKKKLDDSLYEELVNGYEKDTLDFQTKVNKAYVKPKPERKVINLDLNMLFDEPDIDIPHSVKDLPNGCHPSRMIMEMNKQDFVPKIYEVLFNEFEINKEEVLKIYNDRLDLFIFAEFSYRLKKQSLRESASKNDWLDILHSIYLFNHDKIMVSNDKIFNSILPNINLMSVEDYKELI